MALGFRRGTGLDRAGMSPRDAWGGTVGSPRCARAWRVTALRLALRSRLAAVMTVPAGDVQAAAEVIRFSYRRLMLLGRRPRSLTSIPVCLAQSRIAADPARE